MGYTLVIGEAYIDDEDDYGPNIEVRYTSDPDAPDHDSSVGQGNSRSPSYTGWHEFTREVGLETLFYGGGWCRETGTNLPCPPDYHRRDCLLAHHPGTALLVPGDLDVIRAARVAREEANCDRPPSMWGMDRSTFQPVDTGTDPQLARLLWLEFWVKWALDHCETPAFRNT